MKKYILFFFLYCIYIICHAQSQQTINYITSGYYQLIYEADLAFLSGKKDLAYKKIQQAEATCPLIEQIMYYEISRYVQLLCENKEYDKVVDYIFILVEKYGYSVEKVEQLCAKMQEYINFDQLKPKLSILYRSFYNKVDVELVAKLNDMVTQDQTVRTGGNERRFDKDFIQAMQKTDSINELQIKEIFKKYGYPNLKLIGYRNAGVLSSLKTMLIHFNDTSYFNNILLGYVRIGECSPEVLASFVDSRRRMETRMDKYIYRIYSNVSDAEVWDIKNLDNRRLSIGMPTVEMSQKRDSLIRSIYKL